MVLSMWSSSGLLLTQYDKCVQADQSHCCLVSILSEVSKY